MTSCHSSLTAESLLQYFIKAKSLAFWQTFYFKGSELTWHYIGGSILFAILQDWGLCRIHHCSWLAQHRSWDCEGEPTRGSGPLLETLSIPPSSTLLSERYTVRAHVIKIHTVIVNFLGSSMPNSVFIFQILPLQRFSGEKTILLTTWYQGLWKRLLITEGYAPLFQTSKALTDFGILYFRSKQHSRTASSTRI